MGKPGRSGLLSALSRGRAWANHHAGLLFACGLLGLVMRQWSLWQADRQHLAEIQPPPPRPELAAWPNLPQVSALVAAWNEADHLQAHIESFRALRYPHKQLVLVAGGEDATLAIAQRLAGPEVLVLEQHPGEGKQRALRKGFAQASGEILYLTDADCLLDDDSFEQVVYPLAAGQERAVSGSFQPPVHQLKNPLVLSQAASHLYSVFHQPEHAPGLSGSNCAVMRSALLRSQGLQAEAPSGTDYVLAKSLAAAGIAIRQLPHSRVASVFPETAGAYARQQSRWMWNVWTHGRRLGAPQEARQMALNAAVGAGMLAGPGLALLAGPILWAGWGLLFVQGWLARARYLSFSAGLFSKAPTLSGLVRIPLYFLLDLTVWARVGLELAGVWSREDW